MPEISTLVSSLFANIWPFCIGLLAIILTIRYLKAYFNSPQYRGAQAEKKLHRYLRRHLSKKYTIISDLLLPIKTGMTQIDHVVISRHGVLVIETKNYKGRISGNKQQRMWTQHFYRSSYQFYNPLLQNETHTRAIRTFCQLPAKDVQSLVVFVGDSEFVGNMPNNVMTRAGILPYIKSMKKKPLPQKMVDRIGSDLKKQQARTTWIDKKRHIRRLKKRYGKSKKT